MHIGPIELSLYDICRAERVEVAILDFYQDESIKS